MGNAPQKRARVKRQTTVTKREQARNKRIARVFAIFVALVVAFCAGFIVRSQVTFVASLGFPVGEEAGATDAAKKVKTSYDFLSPRIEEVEDLLSNNSLDSMDLQTATNEAIDSMMKSTDDPYAAYFSPERYTAYIKETTDRSYAGIGVVFADYNGRAYVVDVFQGSEAEAKGIQQGDFVSSIDGDSSHEWTANEVVNSLAREDGEQAIITWMRPISLDAQTGSEFTTTLTCKQYDVVNVSTSISDGVGYIRLRQITQNSVELVRSALDSLIAEGATSFVLDVRDNPGGYLTQAVGVASLFVKSGVLVEIETIDGVTTKTASGSTKTDAPVVVLTNSYTTGAAEVLAAALQDNNRAEIVGQTTVGKGSVQVVRELTYGGAVRYTAAYYRTPLGHELNGVGVVPDVSVGASSEGSDTQLLVAIDTARSLAPSQA